MSFEGFLLVIVWTALVIVVTALITSKLVSKQRAPLYYPPQATLIPKPAVIAQTKVPPSAQSIQTVAPVTAQPQPQPQNSPIQPRVTVPLLNLPPKPTSSPPTIPQVDANDKDSIAKHRHTIHITSSQPDAEKTSPRHHEHHHSPRHHTETTTVADGTVSNDTQPKMSGGLGGHRGNGKPTLSFSDSASDSPSNNTSR